MLLLKNKKRLSIKVISGRGDAQQQTILSFRLNNRKTDFRHIALGLPVTECIKLAQFLQTVQQQNYKARI